MAVASYYLELVGLPDQSVSIYGRTLAFGQGREALFLNQVNADLILPVVTVLGAGTSLTRLNNQSVESLLDRFVLDEMRAAYLESILQNLPIRARTS